MLKIEIGLHSEHAFFWCTILNLFKRTFLNSGRKCCNHMVTEDTSVTGRLQNGKQTWLFIIGFCTRRCYICHTQYTVILLWFRATNDVSVSVCVAQNLKNKTLHVTNVLILKQFECRIVFILKANLQSCIHMLWWRFILSHLINKYEVLCVYM